MPIAICEGTFLNSRSEKRHQTSNGGCGQASPLKILSHSLLYFVQSQNRAYIFLNKAAYCSQHHNLTSHQEPPPLTQETCKNATTSQKSTRIRLSLKIFQMNVNMLDFSGAKGLGLGLTMMAMEQDAAGVDSSRNSSDSGIDGMEEDALEEGEIPDEKTEDSDVGKDEQEEDVEMAGMEANTEDSLNGLLGNTTDGSNTNPEASHEDELAQYEEGRDGVFEDNPEEDFDEEDIPSVEHMERIERENQIEAEEHEGGTSSPAASSEDVNNLPQRFPSPRPSQAPFNPQDIAPPGPSSKHVRNARSGEVEGRVSALGSEWVRYHYATRTRGEQALDDHPVLGIYRVVSESPSPLRKCWTTTRYSNIHGRR